MSHVKKASVTNIEVLVSETQANPPNLKEILNNPNPDLDSKQRISNFLLIPEPDPSDRL